MLATGGHCQNTPPAQSHDRLRSSALVALSTCTAASVAQTESKLATAVVAPCPELPFEITNDGECVVCAAGELMYAKARLRQRRDGARHTANADIDIHRRWRRLRPR